MNTKKLVVAVLAVFVFLSAYGYLVHGVLMKDMYEATKEFWRPQEAMHRLMGLVYAGNFLFAILFCFIYTKGIEGESSATQGFRYGLWIGLLLYGPMTVAHYAYLPYPATLQLSWFASGVIGSIVAGTLTGVLYKKSSPAGS